MRSALSDGPVQRQVLLVKLIHAKENRPDFGSSYESDPDSDIQKWFARVTAMMRHVGILEGVKFASEISTSSAYWVSSTRRAQGHVM